MKTLGMQKQNKYPLSIPNQVVDLHGLTKSEAILVVENLIRERKRGERKHVRLIVGKGLNSLGGAVIKPEVMKLLYMHSISFRHAKRDAGGEGVLEVFF
jgi:DNA-nicking Smr family endonuclease